MGALATAAPAACHASMPTPEAGPNAWWEDRCAKHQYTRWPFDLHAILYRACGGNATAIAICNEIAQETHGQMARRGGGRPEWTRPLGTEHFAELLGVTTRAVQDAISLLLDLGMIERRPATNRAFTYQVRPWAWEELASSAGKATQAAQPENSEDKAKAPVVRLTDKPLVLLPGRKSRPVPLDDAVRATLRSVSWRNSLDLGIDVSTSLSGGELCIEFARSTKDSSSSSPEIIDFPTPPQSKQRKPRSSEPTPSSDPALAALRAGIDERFARPNALVLPIDDTVFAAVAVNLAGSPGDLLAYLDTARQRKRVIAEGYRLIAHLAKDVPARSTKDSSSRFSQVADNTAPSILFDCSNDTTAWPMIRAAIFEVVPEAVYHNWFARTRGEGIFEPGVLTVAVPDAAAAAVLSEEYQLLVDRKAAQKTVDRKAAQKTHFIERVRFVVADE